MASCGAGSGCRDCGYLLYGSSTLGMARASMGGRVATSTCQVKPHNI